MFKKAKSTQTSESLQERRKYSPGPCLGLRVPRLNSSSSDTADAQTTGRAECSFMYNNRKVNKSGGSDTNTRATAKQHAATAANCSSSSSSSSRSNNNNYIDDLLSYCTIPMNLSSCRTILMNLSSCRTILMTLSPVVLY